MNTNTAKYSMPVNRIFGTVRPMFMLDDQQNAGGDPPDYKALYETAQARIAADTETFNKRLGGLNQTLQTEQDAHKATKASLDALTTEMTSFKQTYATLEAEKADLVTKHAELEKNAAALKFDVDRKNLLLKDFPQLAQFEGQGLLPAVTDIEKAPEIYKAFSDTLTKIAENADKTFRQTTTPELPPRKDDTSVPKSKILLKEATELSLKGDPIAYDQKMAEYHRAVEEETKK